MNETKVNDENKALSVPYIVWESDRARAEREKLRLIGVIVLLIICFTAYVIYDKWEASQWDYVDEITEDVDLNTDSGGNANYIKNGGEINNGTNTSDTNTQENENETK